MLLRDTKKYSGFHMFHFRLCDLRLFYELDPYREVNMHVDYSFNWLTFNTIFLNRYGVYDFMRDLSKLHNRKRVEKKKNINRRFNKLRSIQYY